MESRAQKIAMLGPYPPAIGGIATNIQNLIKSPLSEKFTLLKFSTMSKKCGTSEYSQEKMYAKICRVFLELLTYVIFLQKDSPQLVHINTSFGSWSFWRDSAYLLMSKVFRKKVLFQIHGGKLDEFWDHSSYLIRLLIKKILEMPEIIAVLSLAQKKPFDETGFDDKVKVVPNTVDPRRYQNQGSYRAKFGISEDCISVLFIASLFIKKKGVMELLNAIKLITPEFRNVLFIFVGGGVEEPAMIEFSQRENLKKNVRFLGYLSGDEIVQILNSSDIFVLPSYSEGFPLVVLEAMAAGLPVIATSVGAIPEIIEDGKNGFLVRPMDHIALAERVRGLVQNEELRKKIGNNNIKKIKEKYDLKIVARIFEYCYETILSGNHAH